MSAHVVFNCSRSLNTYDVELMDAAFPGLVIKAWEEFPLDAIAGAIPNLETVVESLLAAQRRFRKLVKPCATDVIIIFPDELRQDLRQRLVRWLDARTVTEVNRSAVAR